MVSSIIKLNCFHIMDFFKALCATPHPTPYLKMETTKINMAYIEFKNWLID